VGRASLAKAGTGDASRFATEENSLAVALLSKTQSMPPRKPAGRRPRWIGLVSGIVVAVGLVSAAFGPLSIPTALCRVYEGILSDTQGLNVVQAPSVGYDEQASLTEMVNTSNLQTSVTPTDLSDTDGYGPGYLLNGMTEKGYWYQSGVSFNWGRGNGHVVGSTFLYTVFGTSGYQLAAGMYRIQAASGDSVQLSLTIIDGNVIMEVSDSRTCAIAEGTYSAFGATEFGSNATGSMKGFYNGLLTEWWHAFPFQGHTGRADYTIPPAIDSKAYVNIGELVPNSNPNATFSCNSTVDLTSAGPQKLSCENATVELENGMFTTG
jgi:hypothetical protein